VEDRPPFAVPQNHVLATHVEQHLRADFARERAFRLVVTVLRAEAHRGTGQRLPHSFQIQSRRTNGDFHIAGLADLRRNRPGQSRAFGPAGVHLPIAGNEFFTHGAF
jgi:hypothetical protein